MLDISIHSLRVEGDVQMRLAQWQTTISIHSLRVEGDDGLRLDAPDGATISIHSLRVEGDVSRLVAQSANFQFQSTPSVWRETACTAKRKKQRAKFQSTPSVWRETSSPQKSGSQTAQFQSTPSVWRETTNRPTLFCANRHFNPLPPCGGRRAYVSGGAARRISIHSLRVEGDDHRAGAI